MSEKAKPHGGEDVTGQGEEYKSQCDPKEKSGMSCHPATSDQVDTTTLKQQNETDNQDVETAQSTFCDESTAIVTKSDNQDPKEESATSFHPATSDQVDTTALNQQNETDNQDVETAQSTFCGESTAIATGSDIQDCSYESTAATASSTNSIDRENPTQPFFSLPPGAYRIAGPGHAAARRREHEVNNNGNDVSSDEEAVFEGFIPEPSRQDILRMEAQEMLASAITLDESAVRVVTARRDDGDANEGRNVDITISPNDDVIDIAKDKDSAVKMEEEEGRLLERCVKSPMTFFPLTLLLLSAIALGVAFGSNKDEIIVSSNEEPCVIENLQERYDRAMSIVSGITSPETLANDTSPQNKALEWLVCHDRISSKLIDGAWSSGDPLPMLPHGSSFEGDSGESQVLRRYALATFFFATSESRWTEQWNFLSGDKHECAWHLNKTRSNFGFGAFDPAGIVCQYPDSYDITLGGGEGGIGKMHLNFRITNNLTGTIPSEVGHIQRMTNFVMEYQTGMYGSIPSTIGNMGNLNSFTINFAGPEFGGVVPSSLFAIPTIEWIGFQFNEGIWSFPPSIESKGDSSLLGIVCKSSGFSGTLPSFLLEFTSIKQLDMDDNSLEGTVPDSFDALASLEFFNLRNNDLTGTLPQTLGRLSEVTVIALGKNKFTGTLPSWGRNLTKLELLDLSYNEFTGVIPTSFSRLQSLEGISLQHNADLHGPISVFESLGSLSLLSLYNNHFSSTIPEDLFSNSTGNIFADFGHNNFTGTLPETFTQRNTSYLAIMANNFDDSAVDDVICKQVPTLFADCDSCPCCKNCCEEDRTSGNNDYCHFDLDFYVLSGLVCGSWWGACGYL